MLGSGARLKATHARNLPRPVKVAFRTNDKAANSRDELLKWTEDLNSGLHIENWRMLDRQREPKVRRLILVTDRDSRI
jgi:hypothetical protein